MTAAATIARPQDIVFDLESFRARQTLTHNFHPYPAKFVPQIPRLAIAALTVPGETVLDPFCGSGTSLVEAALLQRPGIGIDLNPLACRVARAKTRPLDAAAVAAVAGAAQRIQGRALAYRLDPSLLDDIALPEFHNRDHWFAPHVQRELAAIREEIWAVRKGPAREFLEVAFAAMVVRVSNQDSDTRWVAVEKVRPRGACFDGFLAKLADMTNRIGEFAAQRPAPVVVVEQSSTERFPFADASVALVVTSPPYLNSFDYYLYHKLRLFWLGLDHRGVQQREIGSRNRHSDNGEELAAYVEPMQAACAEIRRVLQPGRFACIVVGDAILRGTLIDMGSVYGEIAAAAGLELSHRFDYDQRRYSTAFVRGLQRPHKRTHVLFFQAPLPVAGDPL